MIAYLLRRLAYVVPLLMAVNVVTFTLFFTVNSPDDMARMHLGDRYVAQTVVDSWKRARGYDRPLFWNPAVAPGAAFTDTIFFEHSRRLFSLDFGQSDGGRDIGFDIRERMGPSLAIAVPVLLLETSLAVSLALAIALLKDSMLDRAALMLCAAAMAISSLFFIIGGQYLMARVLRLAPISGYGEGLAALKFLVLPVVVQVASGLGPRLRWYRAVFLEELGRDYVRTARAKGLDDTSVLYQHVLRNALLPLLTTIVVTLPGLFLGSLVTESFFAVPGLGSYTIDAIRNQDFAIVRAMVFLGSLLYIAGLLLTDVCYAWADPRIRLAGS